MRYFILALSFTCLICTTAGASVPLEPLRKYTTGMNSTGIFAADLDNDGDIDLVTANRGTNDVTVLYNNGLGIFQSSAEFPTGVNPRYVHGGDFDGDGDIDLCTPDFNGMTESILMNDGKGVFTIASQFSILRPAFSWVDDIDGDGHLDVLVAHWDASADTPSQSPGLFTPLLNNGDGTFILGPSSAIGKQPRSGGSADLNGDGIMDVVVANYWSNSLSVIIGLGKRQWADGFLIELSGQPRSLVIADLNGDGKPDIAAVDKTDNQLWIFHNGGDADFTLVESYPSSNIPHSIDAADVDKDGDIDLIVCHVGSSNQLIFYNNGKGFFTSVQTVLMSGGTAEVKFADINNDGELDIVTANVNDNDPGASIVMQGVCELLNDCNNNGVADICETPDCNINGIPDVCDILSGYSQDENVDWVPDECQIDCNDNSIPDDYEILLGLITDCNSNGIPDDCDWEIVGDCDGDGIPDGCEFDINLDFVPDDCQCNADFSDDGEVGVQDLIALIAAWGENPNPHTEPVEEDLNVDFAVDVHDLLLLMLDWGECSKFTLPEVEGACCLGSLQMCIESMQVACEVRNGVYHGDESTCDTVDCSTP